MIEQFVRPFVAATVIGFALSGGASLASARPQPHGFTVHPWVFHPHNCPGEVSKWDTSVGNPAPSLHLTKPCATASDASTGARLEHVAGITLNELNFDYQDGGHCGAGAPRFNVVATDGFHFVGGCANGTSTDLGNGWTHVTFDPSNPAQSFPVIAPGARIKRIDLVFDEGTDSPGGTPGSVYLDNISVNGEVVGGPHGHARGPERHR